MVLESFENRININQLNVESPEKLASEARQHYERLKQTTFYDKENGGWFDKINEKGEVKKSEKNISVQFLDLFVRHKLGEHIKQEYNQLDAQYRGQKVLITASGAPDVYQTEDNLWPIAVRGEFDKEAARDWLNFGLKSTLLYDHQGKKWRSTVGKLQPNVNDGETRVYTQLLATLIESQFDKVSAHTELAMLEQKYYYNPTVQTYWSAGDTDYGKTPFDYVDSRDQLLAILVEYEFDPKFAHKHYEELKTTPLYNSQSGLWHASLTKQGNLPSKDYNIDSQLLAVAVEQTLGTTSPAFSSPSEQLPQQRNF